MMEDIALIVIGALAVVLNILLIIVTLRVKERTKEIYMILGLAIIDSLLPLVAIISGTGHIIEGKPVIKIIPCSIKGPFNFGLMVFSVMIVSIIAIQRYNKVAEQKLTKFIWIIFFGLIFGYIAVLLAAAVKGEFQVSLGQVDCTPQPQTQQSQFSVIVLFLFGLIFLLLLFLITIIYNSKIIIFILGMDYDISIEMKTSNEPDQYTLPNLPLRPVLIRTISICCIYGLLIVPASFLIMIEATTSHISKPPIYSVIISILLSCIAIANPVLVLFAHAIIYKSLTKTITDLVCPKSQSAYHSRL